MQEDSFWRLDAAARDRALNTPCFPAASLLSSNYFLVMATSSTTESIFVQRKRQHQANFLAGRARSAHRLNESLETGLVETVALNSSSSTPPSIMCKRGCPQILCGLKATYNAVGLHPAKVHQQRLASYPLPKKQKRAHRNITGKLTVSNDYSHHCLLDINNSNTDKKHRNNYTHFLFLSLSLSLKLNIGGYVRM